MECFGGLNQRGAAAAALTIAISDAKDGDGPLRREGGGGVDFIEDYEWSVFGGLNQRGNVEAFDRD